MADMKDYDANPQLRKDYDKYLEERISEQFQSVGTEFDFDKIDHAGLTPESLNMLYDKGLVSPEQIVQYMDKIPMEAILESKVDIANHLDGDFTLINQHYFDQLTARMQDFGQDALEAKNTLLDRLQKNFELLIEKGMSNLADLESYKEKGGVAQELIERIEDDLFFDEMEKMANEIDNGFEKLDSEIIPEEVKKNLRNSMFTAPKVTKTKTALKIDKEGIKPDTTHTSLDQDYMQDSAGLHADVFSIRKSSIDSTAADLIAKMERNPVLGATILCELLSAHNDAVSKGDNEKAEAIAKVHSMCIENLDKTNDYFIKRAEAVFETALDFCSKNPRATKIVFEKLAKDPEKYGINDITKDEIVLSLLYMPCERVSKYYSILTNEKPEPSVFMKLIQNLANFVGQLFNEPSRKEVGENLMEYMKKNLIQKLYEVASPFHIDEDVSEIDPDNDLKEESEQEIEDQKEYDRLAQLSVEELLKELPEERDLDEMSLEAFDNREAAPRKKTYFTSLQEDNDLEAEKGAIATDDLIEEVSEFLKDSPRSTTEIGSAILEGADKIASKDQGLEQDIGGIGL